MRTFRDKHFKNEMHSLDAYYECLLSCEINPNNAILQRFDEDCKTQCLRQHLIADFK